MSSKWFGVWLLGQTFSEVLHLEHGGGPERVSATEAVHVALLLVAAVALGRAAPPLAERQSVEYVIHFWLNLTG